MHPAALAEDVLLADCQVRRQRRSGPGGQHRNKVETGIVITHAPTGIRAEATELRSQARNLQRAVQRLRVNLALEVRSDESIEGPTSLWRQRCRGRRIQISSDHSDFPALLAEALDASADADWDVRRAADHLGCSTTQFVKLLQVEPSALQLVNGHRQKAGLRPLR